MPYFLQGFDISGINAGQAVSSTPLVIAVVAPARIEKLDEKLIGRVAAVDTNIRTT